MRKSSWAFLLASGVLASAPACGGSSQTSGGPSEDAGYDGTFAEGGADGGAHGEAGVAEAGGDGGVTDAPVESGGDGAPPEGGLAEAGADGGDAGPCTWSSYSSGLSGANMTSVQFDARGSSPVAYATSGGTLYVSTDSGHTWQTRGTSSGTIGYLAMPGSDPSVLLASSSAGVIKSADSGKTWSLLALGGQSISSIATAPSQSLRLYVGVRGSGVLLSNDSGSSWGAADNGYPYIDTIDLDVAPDNADEVVAGGPNLNAQNGYASTGVLVRTTNAGQSWQTVLSGDGVVWSVRRCSSNPAVLYAATDTGVVASSDRGATWTAPMAVGGQVFDVAIVPGSCGEVYAMVSGVGPKYAKLSLDGGLSDGGFPDGGLTFGAALTTGLQIVSPSGKLAVNPSNASNLLLASHDGVFYSTDATTWSTGQGLLGLIVQTMSVSPLDPGHLWLSSWGSGVWQRPSSTQPWQRLSVQKVPLDYPFVVATDPYTANRIMIGGSFPYVSTDDGVTFDAGTLGQNEQSFAFDKADASVVYVTTELTGIYKSVDNAGTWTASNTGITPWSQTLGTPVIDVLSLALDPADHQTLYAATYGAGIYKSTDGAQSWTNVLGSTQIVLCLVPVPGTPTVLYACIQGGGIERSTDGAGTWSSFNDGLSTLNVGGIALDSTTGDLYATTSEGVFVRHGTQSWAAFDQSCLPGTAAGAPTVMTNGTQRSLVVAAGGGVYSHPL